LGEEGEVELRGDRLALLLGEEEGVRGLSVRGLEGQQGHDTFELSEEERLMLGPRGELRACEGDGGGDLPPSDELNEPLLLEEEEQRRVTGGIE
jgi:hypothetical protein